MNEVQRFLLIVGAVGASVLFYTQRISYGLAVLTASGALALVAAGR